MAGHGMRAFAGSMALLAVLTSNARAEQSSASEEASLRERLDELDQQVRILNRKLELDREEASIRAKSTAGVTAGKDGFGFKSADGVFHLRLRATLQTDSRWYQEQPAAGSPATDTFVVRRLRPVIEGTVFEKYGFRIMPEFAGSTFSLLDLFLDANFASGFRVRTGKFKAPVGLERLQSPADLLMVERAFPTQLLPNRDVGIQVHGDLFDGALSYALGAFDGTVDGQSTVQDNNNGKDIAGRLYARPFKNGDLNGLAGLNLGVAFTTGTQSGSAAAGNLPSFVTPGQIGFFSYATGAYADGTRLRLSPQFYYSHGSFGALGEYALSRQAIARSSRRGQTVAHNAWQLTLSYVLTGEDAGYTRVSPRENFDWPQGTWGAFEIVARVSTLKIDDDTFTGTASERLADPATQARKATDYGLGLNWHLNSAVKVVLNYEVTKFEGGAVNGDKNDERVLLTRFQIAY